MRVRCGPCLAAAALLLCFPSCASAPPLALVPLWARVGDPAGAVDAESGIAEVEAAAFSPDGRLIAAGAKEGGVVGVWSLDGRELWRRFHQDAPLREVEAVAWTADGAHVLSGGEDRTVRVWRARDGALVRTLRHAGSVEGLAVSRDGRRLATGDEAGQLYIWDVSRPDPAAWAAEPEAIAANGPDIDHPASPAARGVHADINSISWAPDNRHLFTAGRDGVVRLWDTARLHDPDRGIRQAFEGFQASIKSVRVSPDGALVAAGGQLSPDALVLVWEVSTGRVVARLDYAGFPKIEAVEWTPDGCFLLTGGVEGLDMGPGRWDDGMGDRSARYPSAGGRGFIRVHDRGRGFAEASRTAAFRQEYFDFSRDGKLMVSSHGDGTLRLWRVERRAPLFFRRSCSEPARR